MDIKDKTAIVTGGASGIGEALCRRFAHALYCLPEKQVLMEGDALW